MKKSKIESTEVLFEDGLACSSVDAFVTNAERRGRVIPVDFRANSIRRMSA